ncbi:N-carbamoyl-L-amino-acid hydrolase [Orbus hercynius]|uniref:N-carbamoyl-L-amino-acid hydrolase n=1 Tax=Orbus hercynius TaxID=593135 RepID=A0A495RD20_9GAMM|nr:M20 family metallo-hydrolase [Orbus hercynius]RKS85170.1 N-carbamoyl-L-amino-acid hydrolase [Orbus hercynius]
MSAKLTLSQLNALFDHLSTFSTSNHEKGTTRLAYSQVDEQAHEYLITKMKTLGLTVRQDAAGNVFARLAGFEPQLPAVGTGSHIDTVPLGGNYDGVAGVLSGIYALSQFEPGQLKRSLEVVIFRAEESSRFGFSCIGSKILAGQVDAESWRKNKDSSNEDIFQVLDRTRYSSEAVLNQQCELANDYFAAFVELHIEQGKCLEAANKQIGIVTGIAAPIRFCVTVKGHADHSGATPMNQRQDALVASVAIIADIHLAACKESCYGTVGTVGKLDVVPNSMNVIPGEVTFFVDIRGVELDSMLRVEQSMQAAIQKASFDTGTDISVRNISRENPVKLDLNIAKTIEQICLEKEIAYMTMLSGAGHDTMKMASKFPSSMIFIPSVLGISHHVDEFSQFEDIALGAELLKQTLAVLASE